MKKNDSHPDHEDAAIRQIAATILWIPTLAARGCDDLDFYSLSVVQIERALRAAYEAGRARQ